MPYKKKYNKRRRTRRRYNPPPRNNGVRRWQRYARYAFYGYKTARLLYRLINVEHKTQDTNQVEHVDSGAPNIRLLTGITQGTQNNERIGNSIKGQYLSVRGFIDYTTDGTSPGPGQTWRIIVFKWKESDTPGIADILQITSSADERTLSPYNKNSGKSFWILRDFRIRLDPDSYNRKQFKISLPCNWHMEYTDSTNTEAAAAKGHIYLAFITDGSVPSDSTANNLEYIARFRFTDT